MRSRSPSSYRQSRLTRCSTKSVLPWARQRGRETYRLLAEAMRSGRSAIRRWAARGKHIWSISASSKKDSFYKSFCTPMRCVRSTTSRFPMQGQQQGTRACAAVDRQHHVQGVRSDSVSGRRQGAHRGADPERSKARRSRFQRLLHRPAPRSSTSWTRCVQLEAQGGNGAQGQQLAGPRRSDRP